MGHLRMLRTAGNGVRGFNPHRSRFLLGSQHTPSTLHGVPGSVYFGLTLRWALRNVARDRSPSATGLYFAAFRFFAQNFFILRPKAARCSAVNVRPFLFFLAGSVAGFNSLLG